MGARLDIHHFLCGKVVGGACRYIVKIPLVVRVEVALGAGVRSGWHHSTMKHPAVVGFQLVMGTDEGVLLWSLSEFPNYASIY